MNQSLLCFQKKPLRWPNIHPVNPTINRICVGVAFAEMALESCDGFDCRDGLLGDIAVKLVTAGAQHTVDSRLDAG
jgi:hypothetical protein